MKQTNKWKQQCNWPGKIKNHCSPSLFHSSFSPPLEQTPTLFSVPIPLPGLQNSCSPPSLIFPHPKQRSFLPLLIQPKPTSFKFPAFLPENPCGVHLVYPMFPIPSLSFPQISECRCAPLFCPSHSRPSCLMPPLMCVVCWLSHEPRQGRQKTP